MTILNINNSMKTKRNLNHFLLLLMLVLLCTQIQCIKFGRRQPPKTEETKHNDDNKNVDTTKVNSQQLTNSNSENSKLNDKENVQIANNNHQLMIKEEKTPQIKPQQTSIPTDTVEAQTKSVSTVQQTHAVDSLFGQQKPPQKSKTQESALTITPEKSSTQNQILPSTVPQGQQTQKKQSILQGLFGQDLKKIEQIAQIIEKKQQVKQISKELPKTLIQPSKSNMNQQQTKAESKLVQQQQQSKQRLVQKDKKEGQQKQNSKKQQQNKAQLSKQQNKDDNDNDQSQEQQNIINKKKNKKVIQEQQDQQQQDDDDIIYSKNQKKLKKVSASPHVETESKYSFTLLMTFVLYSFIIVMVIVTIKCTTSSSKAAKAVNIMVDAVGNSLKKKQGYRPALNEEQITEKEDQITVGYSVDDNKQIFWEKNSVEGI